MPPLGKEIPLTTSFRSIIDALESLAGEATDAPARALRRARAVLLARGGDGDAAVAALPEADGPPTTWDAAPVHAHLVTALVRDGRPREADEALRRAVTAARATTLYERGRHAAFGDLAEALVEAGAADLLPRLAEVGAPDAEPFARAAMARLAAERGDHATARAIVLGTGPGDARDHAILDLAECATAQRRADDVAALAPALCEAGLAHQAVLALATVGSTSLAASLVERCAPGWSRGLALAALASALGRAGDAAQFRATAERALAEATGDDDIVLWWQGHELLAAGATAALGPEGALAWLTAMPDAHRDGLAVELATLLDAAGATDVAKAALARVADLEARAETSTRLHDAASARADRAARAAGVEHARAGRWDDACAAIAEIGWPIDGFYARLEAASVADAAGAVFILDNAVSWLPVLEDDEMDAALTAGAAFGAAVARLESAEHRDRLFGAIWSRYERGEPAERALILAALAEIELGATVRREHT